MFVYFTRIKSKLMFKWFRECFIKLMSHHADQYKQN